VIIIGLLIGSTVMVTTLSSPASNASDKDLLKVTAEKIMTQMLLDSGYPYNWGSDNTSLKVFGLAKYGQTSREAYLLDPDKVLRLNSNASYYFPASNASSLLNLGKDYGFTLEFNETLKVSVNQMGPTDNYSISVASDYALPIMGAKVSAVLYYIDSNSKIAHEEPQYRTTLFDGFCVFNFGGSITTPKVLAVAVDYYGAHTAKLYSVNSALSASLFGSQLIADPNQPYNIDSESTDPREIILIPTSTGFETRDFSIGNAGNSTNFVLDSPPEPSAIAVLAVSENKLLVASRDFSMISYRTIPAIRSAPFAYSIERTVLIGGVTFTATLYFWRMST
jgi:hypothetical protein